MAENTSQPAAADRTQRREKTVVVLVDGDTERLFRTSIYLQRQGYHVFSAGNAEDALKVMTLTTPLVLIAGLFQAHMNGIELLKRVRQDPRTRHVPVIIYTTSRDPAYRVSCEQAGCTEYLLQTDDYNELYKAVQKATEPMPRRFVRLKTWLDVAIRAPGGDQAAHVTALSEQGMFVGTQKPLPYGTMAEFTIRMNAPSAAITFTGMVLYSQTGGVGKNPGMGVKFLQLKPGDAEAIRVFIREKLSEGIASVIETS